MWDSVLSHILVCDILGFFQFSMWDSREEYEWRCLS